MAANAARLYSYLGAGGATTDRPGRLRAESVHPIRRVCLCVLRAATRVLHSRVLLVLANRLSGNGVFKMTHFVSSGTLYIYLYICRPKR